MESRSRDRSPRPVVGSVGMGILDREMDDPFWGMDDPFWGMKQEVAVGKTFSSIYG